MARVIFLTDVEGNWDYFCRFVHRSEGMSFIGDGTFAPHDVALLDGYSLVFGGDAGDKGPGTLRFVRAMLSLKERYPDRVVLLLGNRDINKMRFTSELAGAEIANPRARESPYWVPAKKAVTPFAFLCKVAADAEGLEAEAVAIRPDLVEKHNTKKNRLLWMLNDTMGSMGDFDRRATELRIVRGLPSDSEISDDDVVASFESSVAPGGLLRRYLQEGQLAYVNGDSLFIHGGLIGSFRSTRVPAAAAADCLGYVPGRPGRIENVREWVAALNAWGARQVAEWEAQPQWKTAFDRRRTLSDLRDDLRGSRRDRGGDALLDYCVPTSEPSVVMGRHLDSDSMPKLLPPEVAKTLASQNIFNVFVGHTPHGNCPTVIPTPVDGANVLCVMADTSYSDMNAPDNRGQAVTEVILHVGDGDQPSSIHVHGVTESGLALEYVLNTNSRPRCPVGEREASPDGMFVKAQLSGDQYMLCSVKGFSTTYVQVSSVELERLLRAHDCDGNEAKDVEAMRQEVMNPHNERVQRRVHGFHIHDGEDEMWIEHRKRFILEVFQEIDSNNDEVVSFNELQAALRRKPEYTKLLRLHQSSTGTNNVEEAFKAIDTDRNGVISATEFTDFFDRHEISMTHSADELRALSVSPTPKGRSRSATMQVEPMFKEPMSRIPSTPSVDESCEESVDEPAPEVDDEQTPQS